MVGADVLVDIVLARRLTDVVEDLGAVGDRVLTDPWLELEAEGMQVGIRPNPGEAEQIPGPTRALARLENPVAALRVMLLQVVGTADA